MNTISILNLKGGIAKTTTVRNLAYVLATDYKKKVLLVDLDSSGNLSLAYHLRPDIGSMDTNLNKLLLAGLDFDPSGCVEETSVPGVSIIACNDTALSAEKNIMLDSAMCQQKCLSAQLEKFRDSFDYCLIDCPPNEGMLVINALVASDSVIVPSEADYDAVDAIARINVLINKIKRAFNPVLSLRGVLFTKVECNRLDTDMVEEYDEFPRFKTYIRKAVDVKRSRFLSMSAREYDRNMTAAKDYDNLAAELLGAKCPHPEVKYI